MAIVQFNNDYRSVADLSVRYAYSLLLLFKALGENRNYQKSAAYLESTATGASGAVRDHFIALAKSIRDEAPCNVCGGTHKVNCSACKGDKKVNVARVAECRTSVKLRREHDSFKPQNANPSAREHRREAAEFSHVRQACFRRG